MLVMGSIRNRIFMGILCVVLIVIVFSVMIYYQKDAKMIQTDYSENLYYRVEQLGKSFDGSMLDIYEISVELVNDQAFIDAIQAYKKMGSDESIDRLATLIKGYKYQNRDISSIYIWFRDAGDLITSEEYPAYMDNIALTADRESSLIPLFMQDPIRNTEYILSFRHELDTFDKITVMVNVNERNAYYNYIDNLNTAKVLSVVLLDQTGRIASAKDREKLDSEYGESFTRQVGKGGIVQEKDIIGVYYKTSFSEYSIAVLVSVNEILDQLVSLRRFILVTGISCLSAAFIMSFFSAKVIFEPIKNLTDMMLNRINGLFGQLLAEEKKKRDAQLDALQYQITPHFMYNTLNAIKLYSQMRGEKETAGLLGCFVELLQAVVNKRGVFITVSDEIGILKHYVKLQQFRKGDAFRVTYEIEPEAGECYIPRLVLQPFVENSIMHGFNMREEGNEIRIFVGIRQGKMQIIIADNGDGMTKEAIEKLMHSGTKNISGMSNIGVANVRERLKLYFAEEAVMELTSRTKGVTVVITVPAINDIEKIKNL